MMHEQSWIVASKTKTCHHFKSNGSCRLKLKRAHYLVSCGTLLGRSVTNTHIEQSKNKGNLAIQEAQCLRLSRDTLRKRVSELERIISDTSSAQYEVAAAELDLLDELKRLDKAKEKVRAKEKELGIDGRRRLDRLMNDEYLNLQMNARALKMRIRQKLISRKFERDRAERSLRGQVNGEESYFLFHSDILFRYKATCTNSVSYQAPGSHNSKPRTKIQQIGWRD